MSPAFLAEVGPLVEEFDLRADADAVTTKRKKTGPRLLRGTRSLPAPAAASTEDQLGCALRLVLDEFLGAIAAGDSHALGNQATDDIDVTLVDASGEQ